MARICFLFWRYMPSWCFWFEQVSCLMTGRASYNYKGCIRLYVTSHPQVTPWKECWWHLFDQDLNNSIPELQQRWYTIDWKSAGIHGKLEQWFIKFRSKTESNECGCECKRKCISHHWRREELHFPGTALLLSFAEERPSMSPICCNSTWRSQCKLQNNNLGFFMFHLCDICHLEIWVSPQKVR